MTALLTSVAAAATVEVQAADDVIPGVTLAPSPVSGTLRYSSDYNDVFRVDLEAGETFSARVSSGSGCDVDLYLYRPEATALYADADMICAAAESERRSPDPLYAPGHKQFVAPEAGTYFLNVALIDAPRSDAAQTYTLEWAKGSGRPVVAAYPSASVVGYGGKVSLSGSAWTAGSEPMNGARVELWAWPYPFTTFTRKATMWTSDGTYTLTTNADRTTRYSVVVVPNVPDHAFGESSIKTVKVRPALGTPKVKRGKKYRKKPFTVYGYIRPRHATGSRHVRITATRLGTTVRKTTRTYYYTSKASRYAAKIKLPHRGTWKLVASTPDDGQHAAAQSRPVYIWVR